MFIENDDEAGIEVSILCPLGLVMKLMFLSSFSHRSKAVTSLHASV